MYAFLKIILLLASLSIGYQQFVDRIEIFFSEEHNWIGFASYLILLGICLAGLFSAAFNQSGFVRWSFAIIFATCSSLIGSYELTTSSHMTYEAFVNMMNATGAFHEAWGQHAVKIIIGAVQSILLLLGVGLMHGHVSWYNGVKTVLIPILTIALTSGILFTRGGEGARGLPPCYTGTAYGLFYVYEALTAVDHQRQKVSIDHHGGNDGDIIIIMDESISGLYLDINNSKGVRSGLKQKRDGVAIHNFGLASSISNCSASVNMTMRHGGTRSAYRQINATMPSIWSYGKNAGYETIYIDVPRTGRTLNNLMDEDELSNIDNWVQFDDVPIKIRDHAAAEALVRYINDDKKQFIYLNKIGGHFPVHDKYPDEYMKYKPVLPRGSYLDISDTGDRSFFSGTSENWIRYRNSYRNTILWNVGAFFDIILDKARLGNSTIIYTSDHGQNLNYHGGDDGATHCSTSPKPEVGIVPLVILESDQSAKNAESNEWDWGKATQIGFNRSSHFRIFPTVLGVMGYNKASVAKIYGDNLLSENPDPFKFNYSFNARLGQEPKWQEIDLDKIAVPPVSN